MTEQQFNALMSEIKILSTKMRFIEEDLQEVKQMIMTLEIPVDSVKEENQGNWKIERL
jgi:hypothetical protein